MDAELRIDHGHGTGPHPARAAGVKNGVGGTPHERPEIDARASGLGRVDPGAAQRAVGARSAERECEVDTIDERLEVGRFGEIVGADDWRGERVGRPERQDARDWPGVASATVSVTNGSAVSSPRPT